MWLRLFLLVSTLTAFVGAQIPSNMTYRNAGLKLTMDVPQGWSITDQDKAIGDRVTRLFHIANGSEVIVASAENGTGGSAIYRASVYDLVPPLLKAMSDKAEQIGDSKATNLEHIGGLQFARVNMKVKGKDGQLLTVLLGPVQGNILKFSLLATKEDEIDQLVGILRQDLLFDPEWEASDAPPLRYPFAAGERPKRVRVSQGVSEALLKKQVPPTYPVDARQTGVQGTVVVHVVLGTDGKVKRIWVLNGDPLLVPMTVRTVKQWEYKPYLLNGEPVEVDTQININYQLPR